MAATDEETIRSEIRTERAELAEAVGQLRGALARVKRVGAKLRSKQAIGAGGAVAVGFVKAGGLGATARLLRRRRR
jgi:hypothetical protein